MYLGYALSWPYRLTARTQDSHSCNWSSILHRVTKEINIPCVSGGFLFPCFHRKYGESKGELFAVSKKERPMLWSFVLEWTTTSDCRANFIQKLACRSDGADSP